MRALVVYESMFGNTDIAEATARYFGYIRSLLAEPSRHLVPVGESRRSVTVVPETVRSCATGLVSCPRVRVALEPPFCADC
jgi:hypothetical protein